MTKFPRKNRPLTVAIKGKIDEMPPDNICGSQPT